MLGRAYKFLLAVRLDEGPIGKDAARERLLPVVGGTARVAGLGSQAWSQAEAASQTDVQTEVG